MTVNRYPLTIAALLAMSCRAPASKLPDTQLLRFGVGHRDGSTSFVVHSDLTAEYSEQGGPGGPIAVKGSVTRKELDDLAALLEQHGFCSLVSSRSSGVPDEARPSASVRMAGLDCVVQMWDNEFSDDPAAKASLSAIEALGSAIRARGK